MPQPNTPGHAKLTLETATRCEEFLRPELEARQAKADTEQLRKLLRDGGLPDAVFKKLVQRAKKSQPPRTVQQLVAICVQLHHS